MEHGFKEWWDENCGWVLGVAGGLAFGILALTIGFWRTAFLALCVGVGLFFGLRHDSWQKFLVFLDRHLPRGGR